tara:strand:- start:1536 stop:1733 length:198 start_codon:yes stop_codon:yes gene_type:complete
MEQETIAKEKTVCLPVEEYEDMYDYMSRLKETVDLLNNKEEMKKIKMALDRINSGEFLTKKELLN